MCLAIPGRIVEQEQIITPPVITTSVRLRKMMCSPYRYAIKRDKWTYQDTDIFFYRYAGLRASSLSYS